MPHLIDALPQTIRKRKNEMLRPGLGITLSSPSNGEVERPPRSVGLATRAHNLPKRPRSLSGHASRSLQRLLDGMPSLSE